MPVEHRGPQDKIFIYDYYGKRSVSSTTALVSKYHFLSITELNELVKHDSVKLPPLPPAEQAALQASLKNVLSYGDVQRGLQKPTIKKTIKKRVKKSGPEPSMNADTGTVEENVKPVISGSQADQAGNSEVTHVKATDTVKKLTTKKSKKRGASNQDTDPSGRSKKVKVGQKTK